MLIADIQMPPDCPMCPMAHWNRFDEFKGCNAVNGKKFAMSDPEYVNSSTRPEWCPLKYMSETGGIDDQKIEEIKKRIAWSIDDMVKTHDLSAKWGLEIAMRHIEEVMGENE